MKAITTKFYGPTNTRGSRIIAKDCDGNRISVNVNHADSYDKHHEFAAVALCNKMNWRGELVSGGNGPGSEVFVFTGRYRNKPAFVRDMNAEEMPGAQSTLRVAANLLEHPDVIAMKFAISSESIARQLRAIEEEMAKQ